MWVDGGAGASAPNRLYMWESLYQFVKKNVCVAQDKEWDEYARVIERATVTLVHTYADARTRWIRSRIEPGEQCGILAA